MMHEAMKTFFGLCAALLAVSVMAQEADPPEELLLIGMRTVEGADLARYRAIEAQITCGFADHGDSSDIIQAAERLNEIISASQLFPAAQYSLTSMLQQQAFAQSSDRQLLARELLATADPDLRHLAFNYLLNADGWDQDEGVRRQLHRLLGDSRSTADERSTIVWLFASSGFFETIEDIAFSLARDHGNPNLAHRVAEAIVSAHDGDPDALAEFAVSDARALREELTQSAYRCGDVRSIDTTALLLATAKDRSEPEWVRGEAIEALAVCPDDPANQAALANLLNRSAWFFGATGQHFPVHSLALVIPPLAKSGNPAIRSRLIALRAELSALRSGEREYVEWVLSNALGERREIFQGPVDP